MTNALDSHVREFGIISRLQLLVIVFKILTTFLSTVYLTCKENSFANSPKIQTFLFQKSQSLKVNGDYIAIAIQLVVNTSFVRCCWLHLSSPYRRQLNKTANNERIFLQFFFFSFYRYLSLYGISEIYLQANCLRTNLTLLFMMSQATFSGASFGCCLSQTSCN